MECFNLPRRGNDIGMGRGLCGIVERKQEPRIFALVRCAHGYSLRRYLWFDSVSLCTAPKFVTVLFQVRRLDGSGRASSSLIWKRTIDTLE